MIQSRLFSNISPLSGIHGPEPRTGHGPLENLGPTRFVDLCPLCWLYFHFYLLNLKYLIYKYFHFSKRLFDPSEKVCYWQMIKKSSNFRVLDRPLFDLLDRLLSPRLLWAGRRLLRASRGKSEQSNGRKVSGFRWKWTVQKAKKWTVEKAKIERFWLSLLSLNNLFSDIRS